MAKKTYDIPAVTLITEAKEFCGDCSSLVCVDGEWWCDEFNCSIARIVRCLKWKLKEGGETQDETIHQGRKPG